MHFNSATPPLRLGILGTGNMSRQFVASMPTSQHCTITAIGSRVLESAQTFAAQHCPTFKPAATTYEGLLTHPDVDAIYVSIPNSLHAEWTIRALEAGKHVLCEKPLAMSVSQGELMFDAARRADRLLVEAFMYVSHPLSHAYLAAIRENRLGQVRHIRTSFCYRTNKIAGNVRFAPSLGGGALMDIGCYCIHFSRLIARTIGGAGAGTGGTGGGEPNHISAHGLFHSTGVDEQVSALLHFPTGLTASFTCGMGLQADNTATISGTDAYIEIPFPWKTPAKAAKWTIARSTPPRMDNPQSAAPAPPPREEFSVDAPKDLYALEADDFAFAVWRQAAPTITEADSLGNLAVLDQIREMIKHR